MTYDYSLHDETKKTGELGFNVQLAESSALTGRYVLGLDYEEKCPKE